jgi:S-adenosyl methyltransferase
MPDVEGDRDHEELPGWIPEGVDVTVPNVARIYDYLLGGYHNFAIDREYAERTEQIFPGARQATYANRAFLGRVVRWLVDAGIQQFLDIGSGIPTLGNVHEIAEQMVPGRARVMYVDIDPVAVAHTRAILAGNRRVRVLQADLRRPIDIVEHPEVTDLLNFSEPVAVVLSAVLNYNPDTDDPFAIVAQLRDAIVAGSYIALSHVTPVAERADAFEAAKQATRPTPTPIHYRTREQVARFFTGLDLVEPGIVAIDKWHPDQNDVIHEPWPGNVAAVGRKP